MRPRRMIPRAVDIPARAQADASARGRGCVRAMKLVMATLIRNEEDVLEHNLRYHRAQGVDHFIVTDNGSTDRTPEILGRYEAAGLLTLIQEPATDDYRSQARLWVTRMARVAATELGADWVVHVDADEFWLPATGTLKQALESIPDSYGVVVAPWSEFVARPDGPGPFWERMTVRRARSDLMPKIAHRADPDAVLDSGPHEVDVRARRRQAAPIRRASGEPRRAAGWWRRRGPSGHRGPPGVGAGVACAGAPLSASLLRPVPAKGRR